jgi:hypothetical protein
MPILHQFKTIASTISTKGHLETESEEKPQKENNLQQLSFLLQAKVRPTFSEDREREKKGAKILKRRTPNVGR